MDQNPYEATTTSSNPRTQATRWMIVTGGVLLALAALCFCVTVAMLISTYGSLAGSSDAGVKPSEIASGISTAMIPSVAVVPLSLLGIIFLIVGFVRRQPVTDGPQSQ